MGNLDGTLDIFDKYSLVISDKPVYLFLPVWIIDARDRDYELREYGEPMRQNTLDREQMLASLLTRLEWAVPRGNRRRPPVSRWHEIR